MKETFRLKAEKLTQSYREKYISIHGELYTETSRLDYTDHLVNIYNFKSLVYRDAMDEKGQRIVDEYFKKNNDAEFSRIVSEHMLELAGPAEEAFRRGDSLTIYKGIRPIVQEIAYWMIVEEGVKSVLNHPDLGSWK